LHFEPDIKCDVWGKKFSSYDDLKEYDQRREEAQKPPTDYNSIFALHSMVVCHKPSQTSR
jgi:hypothetical protein